MFRRSCAAALAAFFIYSALWSLRVVYSEYLAGDVTLASTRAALRLTPGDPNLHLQLAYLLIPGLIPTEPAKLHEKKNSTTSSTPEIRAAISTAISLDPYSSSVRLQAAELAEQQDDYAAEHTYLLDAVRLDRRFNPRWVIAQFYARQGDHTRFWPALQAAIAASYENISPLLETAWNFASNPEIVFPESLPASAVPIRTPAGNLSRAQYLDFLVSKKSLDLAAPVATSMLPYLATYPQSAPSLLAYCDQLLWHDQPARALETWNALAAARLIPYPPLNPDRSPTLTNPSFEKPFLQQGFDWRVSPAPGITPLLAPRDGETPGALRFEFSGKQTEHAELASQFVPLLPGRSYALTLSYRISPNGGILASDRSAAADTGFHIRLIDSATGKQDLIAGPTLANLPGAQSQTCRFTVPAQHMLYRLVLSYDRSLGSTRFEGAILLNQFHLAFAS